MPAEPTVKLPAGSYIPKLVALFIGGPWDGILREVEFRDVNIIIDQCWYLAYWFDLGDDAEDRVRVYFPRDMQQKEMVARVIVKLVKSMSNRATQVYNGAGVPQLTQVGKRFIDLNE